MMLRGLRAFAGLCIRRAAYRSACITAQVAGNCSQSRTAAAHRLFHTPLPCAAARRVPRRERESGSSSTATRAAKKQAPGAVGQAGDDDVQVEYVFEGDPEPEGGQKPLAQMTVDFTPDDGVEDDDSAADEDDLEDEFEEEDYEPTCTTGGVPWGDTALEIARKLLSQPPFAGALEMYSFRVHPKDGRIVVRIDKPSDRYGSPGVDDLTEFSNAFDTALGGADMAPDDLTVEVSSPGAERQVRVPIDLLRFQGLPMRVLYDAAEAVEAPEPRGAKGERESGGESAVEEVLDLVEYDEQAGRTLWRVANVRANRAHLKKGQPLSKKVKDKRISIPVAALHKIHLHIDV